MTVKRRRQIGNAAERLENRVVLAANMLLDYNTTELQLQPDLYTAFGQHVYFTLDAGETQHVELWRTDGSSAGTELVTVIAEDHGQPMVPIDMVALDEALLLLTRQGNPPNASVYASDGTAAGTAKIATVPFSGGVSMSDFTVGAGRAWFTANPWHSSTAFLMATDGTAGGTEIISPQTGPGENFATTGQGTFVASGQGFQSTQNGRYDYGSDLWFADHETGESRLVKTIDSGEHRQHSNPSDLVSIGNRLYFTAETELGRELWTSDATAEGTRLLRDLSTGSSEPRSLTVLGDSLYFVADDGISGLQVWRTRDMATTVVPFPDAPGELVTGELVYDQDRILLLTAADDGFEVWVVADLSDEATGPRLLGSIQSETVTLEVNDFGAFVVSEQSNGRSLWWANQQELLPLLDQGFVRLLGASTSTLFFESHQEEDSVVWRTDRTLSEIEVVGSLNHDAGSFTIAGEQLIFQANLEDEAALWTMGERETTILLQTMARNGSTTIHSQEVVEDKVVLTLESGLNDFPLYQTWTADTYVLDGNEVSPLIDESFLWGHHGGWPDRPIFYDVDDDYYFAAQIADQATWDVWKTDLTPSGTTLSSFEHLRTLDPSFEEDLFGFFRPQSTVPEGNFQFEGSSYPLVETSNGFFFVTPSWANSGRALYKVDDHGAELITALPDQPRFQSQMFANADHLYFFVRGDADDEIELWQSDGTSAETRSVFVAQTIEAFGTAGDRLFIAADDGIHGREMWSINPATPPVLHELRPGPEGALEDFLTDKLGIVEDTLYLVADDGIHGREVWAITSDGTARLFDLHSGPKGSNPYFGVGLSRGPKQLEDAIYFSAADGIHGRELWIADGRGVRLERDIRPGPAGSFPNILEALPNRVLFHANDGLHGRELWQATTDAALSTDANGDGVTSFDDFLILAAHFGQLTDGGTQQGDFDGDGKVGFEDFLLLSNNFQEELAANATHRQ